MNVLMSMQEQILTRICGAIFHSLKMSCCPEQVLQEGAHEHRPEARDRDGDKQRGKCRVLESREKRTAAAAPLG
jgi:hypothetical protein